MTRKEAIAAMLNETPIILRHPTDIGFSTVAIIEKLTYGKTTKATVSYLNGNLNDTSTMEVDISELEIA